MSNKQIKDFNVNTNPQGTDQYLLQTAAGTTLKITQDGLLNETNAALLSLQTQITNTNIEVNNNYSTLVSTSGILQAEIDAMSALVSLSGDVKMSLLASTSANLVPYIGATSDVDLGNKSLFVDAVQFNTNPVSENNIGKLVWNPIESTLNLGLNNEVTLQLGQEDLLKVINNTNNVICNGCAVYINGNISGNPSVDLAKSDSEVTARVAGVATQTISAGEVGFITVRGKVRDLNTSGFLCGQEIYLSDSIAGSWVSETSGFALSSHINSIGTIGVVDISAGTINVKIQNESTTALLSQQEINILLSNVLSTGVYEYAGMTIATSASFYISPIKGWIVENTGVYSESPLITTIYFPGGTYPVTDITTQDYTYVLIDKNNNITQQYGFPTPEQRRNNIYLGKILHLTRTSINAVVNQVDYDISPFSATRDMFSPISIINEGITIYADGANLSFNKSSGYLYGLGINWVNSQESPNRIFFNATTPVASFLYATQTSIIPSLVTVIDPANYDLSGVVTAIGGTANQASNQRVYQTLQGTLVIQYGQQTYNKLSEAVAGIQSETFIKYSGIAKSSVLIGVISVWKSASALNNTAHGIFTPASIFGESTGGTAGISTTTLQQAYDNSTVAEIVTNSTLDGFTIRRGSASDSDDIFQLQNGIGQNVLTADGVGNLNLTAISGSNRLGISNYSGFIPTAATIHSSKNGNNGIVFDSYSNIGAFAGMTLRNARGTNSSPSSTIAGDILGFLGSSGYTGSAFSNTSRASIYFLSTENWSISGNGTKISLRTTTNGATSSVERLLIDNDGSITIANISGNNGNIVTHNANGKLLDSGILASSLASTSSLVSVSGNLQTQITNNLTTLAHISGAKHSLTISTNSEEIPKIISISGENNVYNFTKDGYGKWASITDGINTWTISRNNNGKRIVQIL